MLDTAVTNTTTLLVYDDLEAVHEYLVRVFGLTAGPLTRDDRGAVVHGEVRAGSHVIWLHPAADGYRFPRSLGAVTSMTVITVDEPDAHHARSVAAGAAIVGPPAGQPYGVREYGARDPEGRLWSLHAPLASHDPGQRHPLTPPSARRSRPPHRGRRRLDQDPPVYRRLQRPVTAGGTG